MTIYNSYCVMREVKGQWLTADWQCDCTVFSLLDRRLSGNVIGITESDALVLVHLKCKNIL